MTDTTPAPATPPVEPAMTWGELMAETGWSEKTIRAAIRQGVIPGVAFKVEGSGQYSYWVPRAAWRAFRADPTRFSPRPVPMIHTVSRKTA